MDRIGRLSKEVTGKGPEKTPEMQEEINRLKLQAKKVQILEDQRRILDEWREKGEINTEELNKFVLGEQYEFRKIIDNFIRKDPDFTEYRPYTCSREEARAKVNKLFVKMLRKFPLDYDTFKNDYWRSLNMFVTFGAYQVSIATKIGVHLFLYAKTIMILGNENHRKYIERALNLQDFGCFALTELTHGSNVQGCITTATFDERNDIFVVNTPFERGMKFWIGNAAQTANMAVVFANMIVKGKDYGIHPFIVQIRDPSNHNPMPGITIGDCGDKFGLKGIDNGFLIFRNVRIPRENLLDKVTQIDKEGNVTSMFPKKGKRFAMQLGALSEGRVKVALAAIAGTQIGAMIACRFGAVRRQFGKNKYDETCIMNYPSWQNRVFPYFAHSYIQTFGVRKINNIWKDNFNNVFDEENDGIKEMHAIISVVKAATTWDTINGLEAFRQACGGLGFSSYSRLPNMIKDLNVMVTWEGDNNVLLQQTAKFLMKCYNQLTNEGKCKYPSLQFLTKEPVAQLELEDESSLDCPFFLKKILEARLIKAVQGAHKRFVTAIGEGYEMFDAWNHTVPFDFNHAALYYGDIFFYNEALSEILKCPNEKNKAYLLNLLRISTLTKIKESTEKLFGFLKNEHIKMINKRLLSLYEAVKYNLILTFDGMCFSDNTIRSALGAEDGNVYDRLISDIMAQRENFGRPPFWREIWAIRNSK